MSADAPNTYDRLKARYPQLLGAVEQLGEAAKAAGPLEPRQAHLIQLAAAAAARSEGGVHSHTRRALKAGATADEVRHALLLLISTVGFPQVVAALTWAEDVIGE